jgi:hypothetical protein
MRLQSPIVGGDGTDGSRQKAEYVLVDSDENEGEDDRKDLGNRGSTVSDTRVAYSTATAHPTTSGQTEYGWNPRRK